MRVWCVLLVQISKSQTEAKLCLIQITVSSIMLIKGCEMATSTKTRPFIQLMICGLQTGLSRNVSYISHILSNQRPYFKTFKWTQLHQTSVAKLRRKGPTWPQVLIPTEPEHVIQLVEDRDRWIGRVEPGVSPAWFEWNPAGPLQETALR